MDYTIGHICISQFQSQFPSDSDGYGKQVELLLPLKGGVFRIWLGRKALELLNKGGAEEVEEMWFFCIKYDGFKTSHLL